MHRTTLINVSLSILIAMSFPSCDKSRHSNVYLIPEGYVGWVNIYFDRKGAPPVLADDRSLIFKIERSGEFQTSSLMEGGTANDQYYYYGENDNRRELRQTSWGEGGMIWAESFGDEGGSNVTNFRFFVGTEDQLKHFGFKMREPRGAIPSR